LRELLTEAAAVAVAGGALGLGLARATGRGLSAMVASQAGSGPVPAPTLDGRVVAFTAALTLAAGLVFGLVPALRATRADLSSALSEGSAGRGVRHRHRLGRTLLVVQMALSVALLAVTGMFGATLRNLERVDLGFRPEGVAVFRIDPSLSAYQGERLAQLYQRLLEGLRALPGVRSAALTQYPPLSGLTWYTKAGVVSPRAGAPESVGTYVAPADPDLLKTLGVPIVTGRGLHPGDGPGAPPVAVVSEALARKAFGGASPIGRRLALHGGRTRVEIVGVAGDARTWNLREEPAPVLYLPYAQSLDAMGSATFLVRSGGDPGTALAAASRLVHRTDPGLALFDARSLAGQVSRALSRERQLSRLAQLSSLLALMLASLGVYGLLSYTVAGRRREIGIRMALGADRARVVRLVLRELVRMGAGALAGVVLAAAAERSLASLLYGLAPGSPQAVEALAGAVAVMMAVAAAAAWLPARRAARLDPAEVLRAE
jgi:predicted permease